MFELVIIWETGEKSIYEYATSERAEQAEKDMKLANGNQISWSCVRKKYN